jgi:hypothetical protein
MDAMIFLVGLNALFCLLWFLSLAEALDREEVFDFDKLG